MVSLPLHPSYALLAITSLLRTANHEIAFLTDSKFRERCACEWSTPRAADAR